MEQQHRFLSNAGPISVASHQEPAFVFFFAIVLKRTNTTYSILRNVSSLDNPRCMDLSSWNPADEEGSDMAVQDGELGRGSRVQSRGSGGCGCALACDCSSTGRNSSNNSNNGWSINLGGAKDTDRTTTTKITTDEEESRLLPPRRSSSDTNLLRASDTAPTRGKRPTLSTLAAHAPSSLRRRRSSHNMTSADAITSTHEARSGAAHRSTLGGGVKMQEAAPWNGSDVESLLGEGMAERDGVEFEAMPPNRFRWGGEATAAAAAVEERRRLEKERPHQEFSRRRRRRRTGEKGIDAVTVEPLLEVRGAWQGDVFVDPWNC